MNKTKSNDYEQSVNTLKELMGGMANGLVARAVMTQYTDRYASETIDEKHKPVPWRIDKDCSDALVVVIFVVFFVIWFAFGLAHLILGETPIMTALIGSVPAVMVTYHGLLMRYIGYRTLAEAHESYLLIADELGDDIGRKDMQEALVLLERGNTLPGPEYIKLAAYLLDLHMVREKASLRAAFANEYVSDDRSAEDVQAENEATTSPQNEEQAHD